MLLLAAACARAELIDRIAVSIGNTVITTSDIDREIRVTAFQSGETPDFSPAHRRQTAQRMVDQQLIRREMEVSSYPLPDPTEAGPLLEQLRTSRYGNDAAAYQKALADYGITEQDVKDELLRQLTLLRFIEVRFRPAVHVSDQEIEDYFEKRIKPSEQAAKPGQPVSLEQFRNLIEATLAEKRTDQEVESWLADVRKRTDIIFHPEAFE
ncbi:MAG TPA: hypothetical protein VKV17_03810 [Bryobacteraceae bacterium]|nr:hypothetical protein [Bryobacteraceae bacterium]